MDLSMSSSTAKEDIFAGDSIFSQQDLPVVPNDNPETYCRLCLTTPEVVPLFPRGTDPNVYILELIGQYIGIGLTMEDDFSCAVCTSCQLILDQFDIFRQNCLKVDIAIRRRRLGLDRVVVKSEPQHADEDEALGEEEDLPYVRLDNRVYQCRLCAETFRSLSLFMVHCKDRHPDEAKMYKCKHCTKAFMTKTARLQHIRSHQPTNAEGDLGVIRVQVCEKCMLTFDSYKLLKDHIKDQHSNDPKISLVCSTCSRTFSRITILRNHILRVHLGKLPHMCKQCGESFAYAQQLAAHLKAIHGISPDEFGQFAEDHLEDEEELPPLPALPAPPPPPVGLEHDSAMNVSEGVKEEPQSINTTTSTADDSSLKQTNRYTCTECNVRCVSTETLRVHRKIHQDPTWWKCNHCRNFVKDQKMHLQKKHPTVEEDLDSSFTIRYRCYMCRTYFKSVHQMEVHANVKHQVPLPDHHQPEPPSDELEEGEIRTTDMPPMMPLLPVAAPPSTLIHAAAAGLPSVIPQPLTVQPPLPFAPEHLPLLLSQLENGALDYLREFSRLIDPHNQLGLAAQLDVKPNVAALDAAMAMDLSGNNSALNLTNSSSVMNATRNSIGSLDEAGGGESESEDDTFIRLDNKTYQCKFCPETFRHLQLIRKHTKAQHPSEWKSFKCVHCKRRFPSAPMRDRHAHFHNMDHPFKCTECDQMYNSKNRLEKHFAIYHDRNSHTFSMERFKCGSCEMTFVEKKYYDLHSRIFHEKKPQRLKNLSEKIQVCERCFTKFESREKLSEHIKQQHQGDPPLKNCICTTCNKDLKTITLLRIHILVVHMGISPFVCQHCSADFPSRHWLLKHMEKEHSEIALYKCPTCEDCFTTEARLIEHKDKVHTEPETEYDAATGMTLYPCTKCEKKFPSKLLMEKHVVKAHPSFMLMYKCPLCVQPIRYRKQHMRVHHDVEYNPKEHPYQVRYKCHCCNKMFQQKRNLLAHQSTLSFQCSRCQMRFKTKKNLQTHMAAHRTNKSLKCEDCGLDFGYRARLDTHRERYHSPTSTQVLKIINCPYCPKLFISPSNRERHIAANHVQSEFKVNCNHCPVQVSDTAQLRKHYKNVHPEERVTFKCPACERFYLNLSSFKDHYKKHKEEADKSTNSTVDGSDAEGEVGPDSRVKIKQELEDELKTFIMNKQGAGVSSKEQMVAVKREFENGEVAVGGGDVAVEGVKAEGESTKVGEATEEKAVVVQIDHKENGEAAAASDDSVVKTKEDSMLADEAKGDANAVKLEPSEKPASIESKNDEQPVQVTENHAVKEESSVVKDSSVPDTDGSSMLVDKPTEEKANDKPQESGAPSVAGESMEVEKSSGGEESAESKSTGQESPVAHEEDKADAEKQTQGPTVQSEPADKESEEMISKTLTTTEEPKQQEQMSVQEPSDGKSNAIVETLTEQKGDTGDAVETANVEELKSVDPKTSEETVEKSAEGTAQEIMKQPEAKLSVEESKSEEKVEVTATPRESSAAEPEKAETAVEDKSSASGEKPSAEESGIAFEDKSSASEKKPPTEEAKSNEKLEEATDTASNKLPVEQANSTKAPVTENVKAAEEEEKSVCEQKPNLEQKTPVEETVPEVPVNESKTADVQQPEQGIALGNDVVLSETAIASDASQVATSSDKAETECKDNAALVKQSETEAVQQKEDAEVEQTKPKEDEVPSINKEDPPESSQKDSEEVSKPSESKQREDSAGPSEDVSNASEPSQSTAEEKQESPTKPDDVPPEEEENSKDAPSPEEDLRSANPSPTSTAVDSPYTIAESSNEASEISETSSVTSERSTTKRKAASTGDKRRISTRNILKRKKHLMVMIDPVDMDKLVELSRGGSASPSLERAARKGSVSTRGSSSESQPATAAAEGPRSAKRLRRERRTPNSEGGMAGGS